jgi:hypothetical protein
MYCVLQEEYKGGRVHTVRLAIPKIDKKPLFADA